MSFEKHPESYPVEEAVRAQKALRKMAGLEPEVFPVAAFIGMISDEVELLRSQGHSDHKIAAVIKANSAIDISADEIRANYASPEERHRPSE